MSSLRPNAVARVEVGAALTNEDLTSVDQLYRSASRRALRVSRGRYGRSRPFLCAISCYFLLVGPSDSGDLGDLGTIF